MFWRAFKEGLAFRAGAEALGCLPGLLRLLAWCALAGLALAFAAAVLKAAWWLALLLVAGFAYWRYKKRTEGRR
ncbi:MAG: hypothetical protein AB1776_08545 [Bacillota bacterium]